MHFHQAVDDFLRLGWAYKAQAGDPLMVLNNGATLRHNEGAHHPVDALLSSVQDVSDAADVFVGHVVNATDLAHGSNLAHCMTSSAHLMGSRQISDPVKRKTSYPFRLSSRSRFRSRAACSFVRSWKSCPSHSTTRLRQCVSW